MDARDEAFETRAVPSRLVRLLVLPTALVVVVAVTWWARLLPWVVAAVLLLAAVGFLLLGVLAVRTAVRAPVSLRLDRAGLTVSGRSRVPWTEVEAVEIGPLRPRPALGTVRLVATVVPRSGTSEPVAPGPRRAVPDGRVRPHARVYGRATVVPLYVLEAPAEDVATAVGAYGGVPVRWLPVRRDGFAVVLQIIGVVLLAGIGVLGLAVVWTRALRDRARGHLGSPS